MNAVLAILLVVALFLIFPLVRRERQAVGCGGGGCWRKSLGVGCGRCARGAGEEAEPAEAVGPTAAAPGGAPERQLERRIDEVFGSDG